ncbi:GDSL-type esterase/lipase family protein [Streptomyces carpaticus]|uniref:GDSL-type esterase/lipase family protein n=1 Tax=Streptomyces carpaticus TaxID=285558 RepID=UPI0031F9F180
MGGSAAPPAPGHRHGHRTRRGRALLRTVITAVAAAATAVVGLALPAQARAAEPVTVYLAGDSTVQTYDPYWVPQAGWGQVFDRFFTDDVTIANHAIGGRSSRSFIEEGRLDAILDVIRPGDYLFVQFGHNDATVDRPERYTPPDDYKEYLRHDYIRRAKERGAIPVVVTPVSRRSFDPATGRFNVSFPQYVDRAIAVAREENVPLIDLSASSRAYLDSIGPEEAKSVFLHVPAGVYPNRPAGTVDDTHFQEYGAIQMARLVAQDVARLDTPLASRVTGAGTPGAVPERPTGLAARDISDQGARLTWNAVPGADIYRVQRKPQGAPESAYALAATSTLPLADVSGLSAGSGYELRVIAVNARGESAPSAPLSLTTRSPEYRFDFGPVGQVVAAGWTEVNTGTLYSAERGYGFVSTAEVIDRDRGGALDAVQRDFVAYFGGSYEFRVDVPDGTYAATVQVGDLLGSARTQLAFEGRDAGGVSAGGGSVTTATFTGITVTDGQLNVTVSGQTAHLNGLELTRTG